MANKRFAQSAFSLIPVERTMLQDNTEFVEVADSLVDAAFGHTESLEGVWDAADGLGDPGIAYGKGKTVTTGTLLNTVCDGDNLTTVIYLVVIARQIDPAGTSMMASVSLDGGSSYPINLSSIRGFAVLPIFALAANTMINGNSNTSIDIYAMGVK